ncbi:MAG: hypothetical protein HDT22_04955 [Ruminococcus sp.]|nr:hypothetical protein [Ruminococcus sp.]
MENSFIVIDFIQVLFILFVKSSKKSTESMSEDSFRDAFKDAFYKEKIFERKTLSRNIRESSIPRNRFNNEKLKDSFSRVLDSMSEETVEFEKNEEYEECLKNFKIFYKTMLGKIPANKGKEIGKLVLTVMRIIMEKDSFYASLTNQLCNLYKSSKYDIEEMAPCLLDIFLVTLKREKFNLKRKDLQLYKERIQLCEDLKLHPEKYEDDCVDKLLKLDIRIGITPTEFEEKVTEQLQECGLKKEDYFICWLGVQWHISNDCDYSLFEYKCCGAVFASDGIILYEKVSSNKFTPRKVVSGQKYKWILKSKYHDYVLGYEIKEQKNEQKNYPILYKKREGIDYQLINNIEWNGVDISNPNLEIQFSDKEIGEPSYLFILNKETSKFYCCYLKTESQLKFVNIPLGEVKSYQVYTNNESPGYQNLQYGWTGVTISSVYYGLPCWIQLQFSPDGNIIIPEE